MPRVTLVEGDLPDDEAEREMDALGSVGFSSLATIDYDTHVSPRRGRSIRASMNRDGRLEVEVITTANTSVSATLTIAEDAREQQRHALDRREAQRNKSRNGVAARRRSTTTDDEPVISADPPKPYTSRLILNILNRRRVK